MKTVLDFLKRLVGIKPKPKITLADFRGLRVYMWRCFVNGHDLHGFISQIKTSKDHEVVDIYLNEEGIRNPRLRQMLRDGFAERASLALWHAVDGPEYQGDDAAPKIVMGGKYSLIDHGFDTCIKFTREGGYTMYPNGCNIDVALDILQSGHCAESNQQAIKA